MYKSNFEIYVAKTKGRNTKGAINEETKSKGPKYPGAKDLRTKERRGKRPGLVRVQFCFDNFTQFIWPIQPFGLSNLYKIKSEFCVLYGQMYALVFLPVDEVIGDRIHLKHIVTEEAGLLLEYLIRHTFLVKFVHDAIMIGPDTTSDVPHKPSHLIDETCMQ